MAENKEEKEVQKAKPAQETKPTQNVKSDEASSGFNLSEFFKGTKEELDKVVWPDRRQLVSESLAVVLMVTLSATIIYLVDNLFSWASKQVF